MTNRARMVWADGSEDIPVWMTEAYSDEVEFIGAFKNKPHKYRGEDYD